MKGFLICVPADPDYPPVLASIVSNCCECHERVHVSPASIEVAQRESLLPVCVQCLPIKDLALVGARIEAMSPAQKIEFELTRARL